VFIFESISVSKDVFFLELFLFLLLKLFLFW
jgi:hypothetical protein